MSSKKMEKKSEEMSRHKTNKKSCSQSDNEGTAMSQSGYADLFANNDSGESFGFVGTRRGPTLTANKNGPRNRFSRDIYSDY